MTSLIARPATTDRFDAFDFTRALAIVGMLGAHLVGIEGGATVLERGVTGDVAAHLATSPRCSVCLPEFRGASRPSVQALRHDSDATSRGVPWR